MTLVAGARLGSFEVVEPLGAGGMGEVYRARDLKLGRDVAIKVLPPEWEHDPDRLARIDREARVLASLSHPNIAALFGYDQVEGVRFLAMELVPGLTLEERLATARLPVDEALDIGRQIAEALEEAHAKNVIHRDLKPANVKVTPEGRVKVLDFGLAKVLEDPKDDGAQTATITKDPGTSAGLIVGTPSYMSPEQARGQPLDVRTDVWSFGCVLYEMLAGRRAFRGPTLSDTLAAVLQQETDWSPLPEGMPPTNRTLLRRCLEKDRRRRLQSIGDARVELEEALQRPREVQQPDKPVSPRWRSSAAVASGAAVLGLVLGMAPRYATSPDSSRRDPWIPRRLALSEPKDARVGGPGGLAVSPAGDLVAYVAAVGEASNVYVQDLTTFDPHMVKGTEGGAWPSFSPDGRWLAFQSKGFFRKVPVDGGESVALCAAPEGAWVAWAKEDLLLFSDHSTGALMSVPASGGKPEVFLKIDGQSIGVEPDPLPEGKGVFLTLNGKSGDLVAVLDLATRKWKRIREPPSRWPHYVPTGHLMYNATEGFGGPGPPPPPRWVVAPFDLQKLEVTGSAQEVLGDLRSGGYEPTWVTPHGSGILAYTAEASVGPTRRPLEWVDAKGTRIAVDTEGREVVPYSVALSPDGQRLALSIRDGTAFDLWVSDLQRGTWLRLTVDGQSQSPLWSPDGTRIAFASGHGKKDLFWVASDGGGSPELLAKGGTPVLRPTSFSPDGRRLLIAKGTWDGPPRSVGVLLYALELEGNRVPQLLFDAPYPVAFGAFSPDGRWIAFVTLESGQPAVYLRAADLSGRRWALSKGNGIGPTWSRSGHELFFQEGNRLMNVSVHPDSGPEKARIVLDGVFREGGWTDRSFEVGEGRFLVWQMPSVNASARPTRVVVIPNWLDEVRARTRRP